MSSDVTLFSGYLEKDAGFDAPVAFAGPPGWTVFKSQQTEIYEVTHNLGLSRPEAQLHVVVQALDHLIAPQVKLHANSFVISTWRSDTGAQTSSNLMFIAAYHPDITQPSPPTGLNAG